MHLLGVNSPLPAIHNNVVELQIIQAVRVEAEVQVHETATQRGVLQVLLTNSETAIWTVRHGPQKHSHEVVCRLLQLSFSLIGDD